MSNTKIMYEGHERDLAPMEPERHEFPGPAYPLVITPAVAQSWLRFNYRNRNQRAGGKRNYGNDMLEGRYALNGTTITFSRPLQAGEDENVPAGNVMLIDGQHRLESCVASNKPFVSYVCYGLDPESRRTVDTGIKRTLSDVLSMDGESNGPVLASLIKRAHAWSGGDKHLIMKSHTFTHAMAEEFLGAHPEIRRSVEVATTTHHQFHLTTGQLLRQSVAGTAHWLLMQADQTRAPEFFARLGDGAGMSTDHPIMQVRRRLVRDLTVKRQLEGGTRREIPRVQDWEQLCYYIRGWNAMLRGPSADGSYPGFMIVGPRDSQTMPAIMTAEDAEKYRLSAEKKAAEEEAA